MNRDQKIGKLLERSGIEDQRRLALDALDSSAREDRTWGFERAPGRTGLGGTYVR